MLEVLFGLEQMELAELERLQAQLRAERETWWKKQRKASGHVVIKGAGRRSGQVRIRPIPGRRDSAVLADADAALSRIARQLGYIEKELARRAAGEAARA